MRELGQSWGDLSEADRLPYAAIARAERARRDLEAIMEGEDGDGGDDGDQHEHQRTPWGLGSSQSPLAWHLAGDPVYSHEVAQQVQEWLATLEEQVMHEARLPEKVRYDRCCLPGSCRASPGFELGSKLCKTMRKINGSVLDCWLALAEGGPGYLSQLFMFAHKHGIGSSLEWVVLALEPCRSTCKADVESGVNFPWYLRAELVPDSATQQPHFRFAHDLQLFVAFAEVMEDWRCEEAVVKRLEYEFVALDTIEVQATSEAVSLHSSELEDLQAVAGSPLVVPANKTS